MTASLRTLALSIAALCLTALPHMPAEAREPVYLPPPLLTKPSLVELKADVARYAPKGFIVKRPLLVWPTKPEAIEHGPRTAKAVALTFDACSTRNPSRYDERITEILLPTGTRATIFLGGKWMLDEPEHTKRLAASPLFELGNHSMLHPMMVNAPTGRIAEELLWTERILYTLTGRTSKVMRPPYALHDERIVQEAGQLGMKVIEYDLASGDPNPVMESGMLVQRILRKSKPGSIIVMHINGNGHHTAEALPEIIEGLRKKGYMLVTVSELLDPTLLPVPLRR